MNLTLEFRTSNLELVPNKIMAHLKVFVAAGLVGWVMQLALFVFMLVCCVYFPGTEALCFFN